MKKILISSAAIALAFASCTKFPDADTKTAVLNVDEGVYYDIAKTISGLRIGTTAPVTSAALDGAALNGGCGGWNPGGVNPNYEMYNNSNTVAVRLFKAIDFVPKFTGCATGGLTALGLTGGNAGLIPGGSGKGAAFSGTLKFAANAANTSTVFNAIRTTVTSQRR